MAVTAILKKSPKTADNHDGRHALFLQQWPCLVEDEVQEDEYHLGQMVPDGAASTELNGQARSRQVS